MSILFVQPDIVCSNHPVAWHNSHLAELFPNHLEKRNGVLLRLNPMHINNEIFRPLYLPLR
ncbi:hypothetical protein THIOM_004514 [Candidatus Thiomargarita nelsonii]|uniref:Uncharacterized protein n=1 Tax=Candidatus Thiomargarita nelsonii TaxID=1003181 RepID=A0A176RVT1_9GAMM|nr:hypothetical protein THIOM_004514 [Candidatus Thiomargarita nelsonii]